MEMKWEQEKAKKELERILLSFGGRFVRITMRIMLFLKIYNRKTVETDSFKTMKNRYGNSFSVQEEKAEDQYAMVISKCCYNDFFIRNKKPELTSIFCAWDSLWSEEINRNRSCGIRFERPSTLGIDQKDCRFEFYFDN